MKFIVIKTDGTYELQNRQWVLKELQESVDGDLELVSLTGDTNFYIDENGKTRNKLRNDIASGWWAECLKKEFDYDLEDFIAGDAILLAVNEEGEDIGLTDEQIAEFEAFAKRFKP